MAFLRIGLRTVPLNKVFCISQLPLLVVACQKQALTVARETVTLGGEVMRIKWLGALSIAVIIMFAARGGSAQSTFGSIVGTVQDQTGAFIADAMVMVRNLDDNRSEMTATNQAGEFIVLNLKPGKYEVSVEKNGFTEKSVSNIQLDARQERRVDVQLSVRTVSQSVEVGDNAAVLNTENATIENTMIGQQVAELPLNFRGTTTSPLSAIDAAPGVQVDHCGKISVGGALPTGVQYTVDGISTNNIRHTGPLTNTYPSTESISEFHVSDVDNNAEFAMVGDVTFTTKSGTNNYHGSAFEYMQNSALDATTLNAGSKPKKVANTFGGSLGGPIILPRFYNGRDNTFFFVDYEGSQLHKDTAEQYWVPSVADRAGDLADLLAGASLVDPFNSTVGNLVYYPNNTITAINSVAQKVLAYIPTPNTSLANGNYVTNIPTPIDTNGYDLRIDRILTKKQQIFARWRWKDISSQTVNSFLPSSNWTEKDRSLVVSHNYVISPRLLNEARFGLSYWRAVEAFPINGDNAVNSLGITGLDLSAHPTSGGFPYFDFSNGDSFTQIGRDKDGATQSTNYQFSDSVSWVKGHHSLKFGADAHLFGYQDVEHFSNGDDFGTFSFEQAGFTGSAFGDFLLGLPSSTYSAVTGPDLNSKSNFIGFYGQDEYRLSHRLTISFGLRWELHPPFSEKHGNLSDFDFAKDDVIVPDHTLAPAQGFLDSINLCPGGKYTSAYYDSALPCTSFETASQVGLGPGLGTNYYGNWDPRLGIAYRPFGDSNIVIRAGVGVFTAGGLGTRSQLVSGVHTADVQNFTNFQQQGIAPAYQFPSAFAGNGNSAIGTATFMCGTNTHLRDPASAQWNLTIERVLRGSTTARASYIGMNTYRLENMEDINQVTPSTALFATKTRPLANWDMIHMLSNNAGANYQAFQSEVTHHIHCGLTLQGSYTLAKNLTNAEGTAQLIPGYPYESGATYTNRYNHRGDRGNDFGTRRQRALFSGFYHLPVGRGKSILGNANRFTDALLGQWKLSTITLLQTGPFETPIEAITDDPANIGIEAPVSGCHETAARPDRIGNGNLSHHKRGQYFDSTAFQRVVHVGRDGNAAVGSLKGPGTVAIAGGLSKEFSVGEGKKIHFESTFTNLPNHVNYAPAAVDFTNLQTFGTTSSAESAENAGNRTGQFALRYEF
jgi:hypothetical protein